MTTCIVSAYFKIPSKKPHEFYIPYLLNFFNYRNIKVPLVFFTSEDMISFFQKNCKTDNVFFYKTEFEDLLSWKEFGEDFWKRQYERDIEKYHSPQLGAIWCNKRNFILEAIEKLNYDVYIWCDSGCIREPITCFLFQDFGSRNMYNLNNGKIFLGQVGNELPSKKEFYTYPTMSFACGLMAGNREAWTKYKTECDKILRKYDENNITGNSDQNITLSCYMENSNLFEPITLVPLCDPWMKCTQFF